MGRQLDKHHLEHRAGRDAVPNTEEGKESLGSITLLFRESPLPCERRSSSVVDQSTSG